MPLIPTLGGQLQEDLREFNVSLGYTEQRRPRKSMNLGLQCKFTTQPANFRYRSSEEEDSPASPIQAHAHCVVGRSRRSRGHSSLKASRLLTTCTSRPPTSFAGDANFFHIRSSLARPLVTRSPLPYRSRLFRVLVRTGSARRGADWLLADSPAAIGCRWLSFKRLRVYGVRWVGRRWRPPVSGSRSFGGSAARASLWSLRQAGLPGAAWEGVRAGP